MKHALVLAAFLLASARGAPQPPQPRGDGRPEPTPPQTSAVSDRRDAAGDPLPLHAVARIGTTRLRHGETPTAVRYGPDGRIIAAGDWDGHIRMWVAGSGKQLWTARPYRRVDCLAFSPTGKLLASAGPAPDGSAVILWAPATGREVGRPLRTKVRIDALAFSPDGKRLAVAVPNEHVVRVLDVASGEEVFKVEAFCTNPDGLCFSPDGSLLAAPDLGGAVRLWNGGTGAEVRRLGEHARVIRFSPDGSALAVQFRGVRFFAVESGKLLSRFDTDSSGPLAYTPDSKTVLVGEVGAVRLLDVATGKEVRQLGQYSGSVTSLSVSPDGKTVAVGSTDCAVRLMDIATGKEVFPDGRESPLVHAASLSPDGKSVAASVLVGKAAVWAVGHAEPNWIVSEGEDAYTNGIAFSPDGKAVAVSSRGTIRLRDTAMGKLIRDWQTAPGTAVSVAFSPDGRDLASAHLSDTVLISNVVAGAVRLRIPTPDRWVRRVLYTSDGRFVATPSDDGPVRLWEVPSAKPEGIAANGHPRRSFAPQAGAVFALAGSPDGHTFASGGWGGAVVVTESITGGERGRWRVGGAITALAFAPDSRVVAVGDSEGAIMLCDPSDGEVLCRLDGHRGAVTSLGFARDGRLLLSASEDTTALVWSVPKSVRDGEARRPGRLSGRRLEALWADLAHGDAAQAYRAIIAFAGAEESVPFLRERLVTSAAAQLEQRRRIERLIGALGSAEFAERERATTELKQLGHDAEPWLRRAAESDVPEVRDRAVEILKGARLPRPETLRALRAIEILERIATPDAEAGLRALSEGEHEFHSTRAAGAALRRMSGSRVGRRD